MENIIKDWRQLLLLETNWVNCNINYREICIEKITIYDRIEDGKLVWSGTQEKLDEWCSEIAKFVEKAYKDEINIERLHKCITPFWGETKYQFADIEKKIIDSPEYQCKNLLLSIPYFTETTREGKIYQRRVKWYATKKRV